MPRRPRRPRGAALPSAAPGRRGAPPAWWPWGATTPAAARLRGGGQPVRLLPGALDLLALVGAGLRAHLAAGEREPHDRALHHAQLLEERPGVVGQLVALADLAHARRDLAVAGARHVGVEVVLDLVAEVAADDVEERAALDVGGADQLAHVAPAGRLVLGLVDAERVRLVREVAAEDDRVGPHVADHVGGDVGGQRGAEGRAPQSLRGRQRRVLGALRAAAPHAVGGAAHAPAV